MFQSIKRHGIRETMMSLALCLVADVFRVWLHLIGQHALAHELLAEERKLWG